MEIIWIAVNHHRASYDIRHTKAPCHYGQTGPAMARQQGREISGVVWMRAVARIKMTAGICKVGTCAGSAFMDVKSKKVGGAAAFPAGKAANLSNHPCSATDLKK